MNILYLHGFQSSSNTNTVKYLQNKLLNDNFYCVDLPYQPEQAIKFIESKIIELNIDIIVGTSLGGVYAYNFDLPKICINPAFQFKLLPGSYQYFNKRNNGEINFIITENDLLYLNQLINSYKTKLPIDPLFYMSYILIGTDDNVVSFDNLNNYTNVYDEIIYHKFEHRLTETIIDDVLIDLIERLKKSINTLNNIDLHE